MQTKNANRLNTTALTAGIFALGMVTGCNNHPTFEDAINEIDATMGGHLARQLLDGSVDRASSEGDQDHLFIDVETQQARGLMSYFGLFSTDEPFLAQLGDGRVYGTSITGGTPTLNEEGTKFFGTDEVNIEEVSDDIEVAVGDCEGPTIDDYEEDEPFDNVVFRIEACADCAVDDEEAHFARRLRYVGWNNSQAAVYVTAIFDARLYSPDDTL